MKSNLEKYKKDLDSLIQLGEQLFRSLCKEYDPSSYKKLKNQDVKKLPNFQLEYQGWYSESLAIIEQLIPKRKNDFMKWYKTTQPRKTINIENYTIEDCLISLQRFQIETGEFVNPKSAIPKFLQQLAILKSAKQRFESSLFDIKQILQADLFDSELEAAKELNKKGFVRGAGAIAGVVLEGHLKEVCNKHKITVKKKNPTINDLNQLLKDNETIDTAQWRNIQRLADLRNLCDHKKQIDPNTEKVTELIEGVEKIKEQL